MTKKEYQEPCMRVCIIEGGIIAASTGMEDWGSAGTGGGTINRVGRYGGEPNWEDPE